MSVDSKSLALGVNEAMDGAVIPANLPALVSRAGQRLLDARNSAEVLEAKHIAESALHYAKLTRAANETHADCLRIITRAEIRMADEIDAGQVGGSIAGRGRPSKMSEAPTFSNLGIRRDQVHEWRQVRDAGPEVVEQAIRGAIAEGRAPTKADISRHVRGGAIDEPGIEDEIDGEDPENYRTALLLRIDQARRFAVYSGPPVTQEIVTAARAVAVAWNKLAQQLENHCEKT